MKKLGRNDPCPCGSGSKHKKCCLGKKVTAIKDLPPDIKLQMDKINARRKQLQKQQGLGREIVAVKHQGYQFVAVGSKLLYSKKWLTFHDFLRDYLPDVFGEEWYQAEVKKTLTEQHPLIKWREIVIAQLKATGDKTSVVKTARMKGATFGYFRLAYNLFLLATNAKLQQHFVKRLKNKDNFHGACYESYVAAIFVKAGFRVDLENELDGSESHCEFTAAHPITKESFSVEAKARRPHKQNVAIGNQLYWALQKKAKFKRIVFVDVNVPELLSNFEQIKGEIDRKEANLTVGGAPADQAYIFVTNHSYTYDLEGFNYEKTGFCHGFKIPDLKTGFKFENLREALKSRELHKSIHMLIESMQEHTEIPSTFDGEHPEFAFNPDQNFPRLVIGNRYLVPTPEGEQQATLMSASVSEIDHMVMGIYQLADGKQILASSPMTEDEVSVYKRSPETFFGIEIPVSRKMRDPIDWFDFFYKSYKESSREKILEFMAEHPDIVDLRKLSEDEVRITYCERLVYRTMRVQPN